MGPIYLDHNATTPLLPEAWDAMRPLTVGAFGNPASAHHAGRAARRALEDARERVAALLGAAPDEVTFTSGATEANNLALFGLVPPEAPGHVLASPVEHPCVTEPLRQLEARGWAVEWLPVSARGVVPADAVAPRVRADTRLVSVMLVNHETGAIQPVGEIAAALSAGVPVHTDAAQAVGKLPVDFRWLGVTALTASAHKFRGPKGVGVLLLKRGTPLRPLLFGGHQQGGRRPGTEPVPLAVGLAVALEHAVRTLDANRAKLEALRARLWGRLQEQASPVVLNGPEPGRPDALPTTLNVSFPGCRADLLLMALDLAGVACSAGSACSSGSLLPSPVLRAMGVPDDVLRSAVRFSFGPDQDFADIDDAADRIAGAVRRQRPGGAAGG
jgi:cysteine desulfurase